jgi:hypothetical protein
MRKLTLTLAAAGAAIAFAAPASAQIYAQPNYPQQGYGYGYNQNYGHRYNANGQVQRLQMRIDMVQRYIHQLDRADRIRNRTADRLRNEARGLEYRLRAASRYGLNPMEARDIELRLANLERRVSYAMNQRFGRGWNNYREGQYAHGNYGNGYYGQDREDGNDDDRRGGWGGRDRDGDGDGDDD